MASSSGSKIATANYKGLGNPDGLTETPSNHLLYPTAGALLPPTGGF